MAGFQTQTTIQALLAAAGLRPQRRHGQHFLIDRNLMNRLVEHADIRSCDTVIEVGTGTGCLTGLLAERCSRLHTFEIDRQLYEVARKQLEGLNHVTLHGCDALRNKNALCDVLADLVSTAPPAGEWLKLAANLPYDAATPLLMELLLSAAPPTSMTFTIQREVGLRLLAHAGSPDYGPVSVVCRLYATIERVAAVPPEAFWPRPKVDSVLLHMRPIGSLPPSMDRRRVAALVRRVFQQRRKRIGTVLRGHWPDAVVKQALCVAGADPSARPEVIEARQWDLLAGALPGEPTEPSASVTERKSEK